MQICSSCENSFAFSLFPPTMPKVALSGCRTAADGSKDDASMHAFRKEMVSVFAKHFGKESPNYHAVKTAKAIFPDGVQLEHDTMHQDLFREVRGFCPDFTCHITHIKKAIMAVHEQHSLKGKILEKRRMMTQRRSVRRWPSCTRHNTIC